MRHPESVSHLSQDPHTACAASHPQVPPPRPQAPPSGCLKLHCIKATGLSSQCETKEHLGSQLTCWCLK